MSSYEVGAVEVGAVLTAAPGAVEVASAALIVASGAVKVASAVLKPVGYALYKTGTVIYDELVREHQEAIERQMKEQAKARARLENAQRVRNEIIEECNNKIAELKAGEYGRDKSLLALARGILSELQSIASTNEEQDVVSIELQNKMNIQRIRDLTERLKTESRLISNNSKENLRMLSFIETMETLFDGLTVDDYFYIHNIKIEEEEKVVIKKLLARIEALTEKFYVIVGREVDRFGNYPISSVGVDRIASLFAKISSEIKSINMMEIEPWVLEEKIHSIEKSIDSYFTYKALLDKEQEKFLSLYLRYKQSCEKVGEEYKEAVEFDSFEELEATVKERIRILERAKKCSEIYSRFGRDAYICMAFEVELNALNYKSSDKKEAESILNEKLRNYRVMDKLSPFYEYEEASKMQIFKVNDEVGVQLIIHSDGTSTVETISLNKEEDETVVEAQKEHCKKSKLLEEALLRNWFISANFDETMSADHISFEFAKNEEKTKERNQKAKQQIRKRLEAERARKRSANNQKAQARSMALKY